MSLLLRQSRPSKLWELQQQFAGGGAGGCGLGGRVAGPTQGGPGQSWA